MRIIKRFVEQMKEELSDAKEYATLATEMKATHPSAAQMYYKLAQEELSHANLIHAEAVKAIEARLSKE